MKINWPEAAPDKNTGHVRAGKLNSKLMFEGGEGPNYYRLTYEVAEESWSTPAHRHNFDQIRIPLVGEVDYGKSTKVPVGSVAYFPESVHYGPQQRPHGSIN